ncbi:MAG TPA: hypothetical protein VNX68_10985 [Nitrosopumilaceae archaeon]|nr:hypothetical protein [Nitrosopumilaceae archaeon]
MSDDNTQPTQDMVNFLQKISPHLTDTDAMAMATAMVKYLPQYGITTDGQLLVFLAQIAYESTYFTAREENLNYSAASLLRVFPTHFTASEANYYAHKPQSIASRAYANRYGNSNEASGDGFRYRGRGFIQITFKDNYIDFAKDTKRDFATIVDYVATMEGAVESACWFWHKHNLQRFDLANDMTAATMAVQGSDASAKQRISLYNNIVAAQTEIREV